MDYSYYLKNYSINSEKLIKFGFTFNDEAYTFSQDLQEKDLCLRIKISSKNITIRVIDKNFNDDYLPFNLVGSDTSIKHEVEAIWAKIVAECLIKIDIKNDLIDFMQEKFGTIYEQPWRTHPSYYIFRTQNTKKWYAAILEVPQKVLGLEGDNLVQIINLKLTPNAITQLIDNQQYFKAYHMNKEHWITILLNKETDFDTLKKLIENSYNIVETTKNT